MTSVFHEPLPTEWEAVQTAARNSRPPGPAVQATVAPKPRSLVRVPAGAPACSRQCFSWRFPAPAGTKVRTCDAWIARRGPASRRRVRIANGRSAIFRIAIYSQRSKASRSAAPAATASVVAAMTTVLSGGRSRNNSGLSRLCGCIEIRPSDLSVRHQSRFR